MARIGVYGGTFNPPHLGHLLAAEEFRRNLDLDLLLLVPAAMPPHKPLPPDTPDAQTRLELLRLAAAGLPFVRVDDLELRREGPDYTVDTLRELKRRYPNDELFLCMGTDMFLSFESWYSAAEICTLAEIAMARRENDDPAVLQAQAQAIRQRFGVTPLILSNRFLEVSSTTVRRMLILGGVRAYLSGAVLDEIRSRGLYGTDRNRKNLPFAQLKRESLALHNEKRIPHVIGCSETAAALAEKYGVDPADAARAGILHDVTKALVGVDQLHLCDEYGIIISDFERENTKLLHSVTGGAVAKQVFGERDEVSQAIWWHTSGKAGMTTLEKIIYVADYMEPNRDFPGVDKLRRLAFTDLDAALLLGLEMTKDHLKEQGQIMGRHSAEAIAFLKAKKG